ncbi:MAG TPA: hypothetical protein VF199_14895 [Bacillales bacterium]
MKLLSAILIALLLFSGTACLDNHNPGQLSTETEESGSQTGYQDQDSTAKPVQALDQQTKKRMVLTWEVKLSGKMHIIEQPFNKIQGLTISNKKAHEEWTEQINQELDKATLNRLVKKASKSYSRFAGTLKERAVPSKLPENIKKKLQEALNELTAFYTGRAKSVKKLDTAANIQELKKKIKSVRTDTLPDLQNFNLTINQLHYRLNLDETDFVSELDPSNESTR